jgi:hypothetical protein
MAIGVMTWVWKHSQSRHSARLVLLAIADSMNTDHSWAWPSTKELARKAGLTGRAVQLAVADLVKLRELEVGYNEGPKGCNRFRVLMTTPEKFSPPKSFHPEDSSPPKDFRGSESAQANGTTPEDFSPPEDSSPPKNSTPAPEEFSPGTVKEPKTKNSLKESSTARNAQEPLLPVDEIPPGAEDKPKRGRRVKTTADPLFDEWYAAYPVHKSRGDAETAWPNAIREADPQVLIAAAKRYSSDPQVLRGYGKYPATWLNKKCWLDEDAPAPDRQSQNGSHPRQPHRSYQNPPDDSVYEEPL